MTDRRQRQKESRAARLEVERKAAARREMRKRLIIALGIGFGLAGVLLLTGVLSNRPPTLPDAYLEYRDQPTACEATAPAEPSPAPTFPVAEDQQLDPAAPLYAVFTTSCGSFTVELDTASYPQTVNSLVFLAREGFYDSTVFHRVSAGFVVQGGDPNANGTGGPGYTVPDEFPPSDFVYERGVVAMANRGNGTTGSQFFVVLGENASGLRNAFSIVGRVVAGEETLDRIGAVPTALQSGSGERSRPLETVYVERVTIQDSP
jgi:cyclophilin family peptidyl-prolyl cis-trans isomerase